MMIQVKSILPTNNPNSQPSFSSLPLTEYPDAVHFFKVYFNIGYYLALTPYRFVLDSKFKNIEAVPSGKFQVRQNVIQKVIHWTWH